jgi:hypothetical protein
VVLDAAEITLMRLGFNRAKRRGRGQNIIGHSAIVNVPGQRGGNITMYADVSQQGVLYHHANRGPYNTDLLFTFLDTTWLTPSS